MTTHALGKHSRGLATYSLGASIAELEIECQLNNTKKCNSQYSSFMSMMGMDVWEKRHY